MGTRNISWRVNAVGALGYCSVTRLGEDWLATSWPTAWVRVLRLCFPMNNDTDLFEVAVTLVVIVKYS